MKKHITMLEYLELIKSNFLDNEIKNIIEIGSLNGNDSLFFKKIYPQANVYCFEGLPDNYLKYRDNLKNINFTMKI